MQSFRFFSTSFGVRARGTPRPIPNHIVQRATESFRARCSFYRHLRNVSLETDINKPNIEFTADGDLKNTELKIMNLRPSGNSKNLVWEEVRLRLKSFYFIIQSLI